MSGTQRPRLDPKAYCELKRQVLERDGWTCQYCGSRVQLQVHHMNSRAHLGPDTEENLITLCAGCHESLPLHRSRL